MQEAQPAFAHPLGLDESPGQEARIDEDEATEGGHDLSLAAPTSGEGYTADDLAAEMAGYGGILGILADVFEFKIEKGQWWVTLGEPGGERVCLNGGCWCSTELKSYPSADGCDYMNRVVSKASLRPLVGREYLLTALLPLPPPFHSPSTSPLC